MLNRFIKIAQKLDEMGMYGDSDRVTDVMQSLMPEGEEETEDISLANLSMDVAKNVMDYYSKINNADFLDEYRGNMKKLANECRQIIFIGRNYQENLDKCLNHFDKMFPIPEKIRVSSVKIASVHDEEDEEEGDFEYDMAKNELNTAMEAIEDLMNLLGDDEGDLPAWVQSKITKGVDYLDSVADYMKGLEKTAATKKKKNVKLNKPFRTPGGPKKFSVYVKNEKGNVVKVNFGDPNMKIKSNIPGRRKNFRARHHCENPGSKTKARYWSCRQWSDSKSDI
jgi:hypothetical protein